MIAGTGIDIVKIDKIRRATDRWQGKFTHRVFTEREVDVSRTKRLPYEYLAARFAAKEAIMKAFGASRDGINLKDIEILNEEGSGRPLVVLHNEADAMKRDRRIADILVSISHTTDCAVANAILVGRDA